MHESTGIINTPPKLTIYGVSGIGKTTFAASAPNPRIIDVERGSLRLNVNRAVPDTFAEVLRELETIYREPGDIKTVVVDSLDWLERKLIWPAICAEHRVKNVGDIPYGRGYDAALVHWVAMTDRLDAIAAKHGIASILVAHEQFERFEDPESSGYDRYTLKIHRKACQHVIEWSDAVLFATRNVVVREAEGKFGKKVAKAIGGNDRVLRTTARPAAVAKNRFDMPDEIELDWNTFSQFLNPQVKV